MRFDLGVVGQHADGAEAAAGVFVRGEKFLHRFGRVGVVVKDLLERAAAGPSAGQSSASGFGVRGGFLLGAAKAGDAFLDFADLLFECPRAVGSRLPCGCGGIGALPQAERFLEQLMLFGLEARLRFGVVCERFFRLALLAVKVNQVLGILAGFLAQVFHRELGLLSAADKILILFGGLFDEGFELARLLGQCR